VNLWSPDKRRLGSSHMKAFWDFCQKETPHRWETWDGLHLWSLEKPLEFWPILAQYLGIRWHTPPQSVFKETNPQTMGGEWFGGGTLNFAEHFLETGLPQSTALLGLQENVPPKSITFRELKEQVFRLASFLKEKGLKPGDRVFAVTTHSPEAVQAMLATTLLGGVWASSSPDFGLSGLKARVEQVAPKFLLYHSSYSYNGKVHPVTPTIQALLQDLPAPPLALALDKDLPATQPREFAYPSFDFDHPVYIVFSSGTTGKPKCIVHRAGGVLLQQKKELALHCDIKKEDRLLYYTTCAWMMWHWSTAALTLGAGIVTYDGSPFYPKPTVLWEAIKDHKVTAFGTSPRYLSACEEQALAPQDLESLRTLLVTGAPVLPHHYRYVYGSIKKDLHMISLSGGTDILGCFMIGNPLKPVQEGRIQGPALGMNIQSWSEGGTPQINQKGELVSTQPFPSQPLGFLHDPDGALYKKAYFSHYPGVWRHGDFIQIHRDGSFTVFGRSDTTLNPGGVRIGTGEIYGVLEQIEELSDSIAVGWVNPRGEEEVLLFVQLKPQTVPSDTLKQKITTTLGRELTPRHRPGQIFFVQGIPYTKNQKKMELPLRDFLAKKESSQLSDPGILGEYGAILAGLTTN
jgi:acetoacetyl-CoA synthetase